MYHLYTTYILPIGWLCITYHLLREPETAIDLTSRVYMNNSKLHPFSPNKNRGGEELPHRSKSLKQTSHPSPSKPMECYLAKLMGVHRVFHSQILYWKTFGAFLQKWGIEVLPFSGRINTVKSAQNIENTNFTPWKITVSGWNLKIDALVHMNIPNFNQVKF